MTTGLAGGRRTGSEEPVRTVKALVRPARGGSAMIPDPYVAHGPSAAARRAISQGLRTAIFTARTTPGPRLFRERCRRCPIRGSAAASPTWDRRPRGSACRRAATPTAHAARGRDRRSQPTASCTVRIASGPATRSSDVSSTSESCNDTGSVVATAHGVARSTAVTVLTAPSAMRSCRSGSTPAGTTPAVVSNV